MVQRANTNPHIWSHEFAVNKNFPNNRLPVLVYRQALTLPHQKRKSAEIVRKVFAAHGWGNAWQNGIYDFHHFHSNTHECLGICMGEATVILGGPGGLPVKLGMGDVIILPAGVGHKCSSKSEDFLCVGAYPQGKDYDIKLGKASEFEEAKKRIASVPVPAGDPVFGNEGFLKAYWSGPKG